jgi:hypothetical protein
MSSGVFVMSESRLVMGHPKGEHPPNTFEDFAWVREHEAELLDTYGEGFVLVFEKQVIGFGKTYQAALADAESKLPPKGPPVTPITTTLWRRQPFFRVRPHLEEDES